MAASNRSLLYFLIEGINPEPWTTGEGYVQRVKDTGKLRANIAKDAKLDAYQQALRETFLKEHPDFQMEEGDVTITFYLWREKTKRAGWADATNLQKATEDALQGVLYSNDARNRDVRCVIMEQDEHTEPKVLIELYYGFTPPANALTMVSTLEDEKPRPTPSDNFDPTIDVDSLF